MDEHFITIGFAFIAGIATVVAFIYKRGISKGMDSACELQIKKDIKGIRSDFTEEVIVAKDEHKMIRIELTNVK